MLEAKASWGHTGIAGGFIVPRYKNAPHFLYHWKCGVGIALVMSSRKNIMLSAIIPTVKGTWGGLL